MAEQKASTEPQCVVYLENVQNPHNLGAIVRVCAHFGVTGVMVSNTAEYPCPTLSSSVYRIAEGGLESTQLILCQEPVRALRALRNAGFALIGTSSHAEESLFSSPMPERTVILFGSEHDGLSPNLQKEVDRYIVIPGSGKVESLNVACAASAVLSEFWRLHKQAAAPTKVQSQPQPQLQTTLQQETPQRKRR